MSELDDEQKEVINNFNLDQLLAVIRDMKPDGLYMTPVTFCLAMDPRFRKQNVTPEAVVDYCLDAIKRK